MAIKYIKGLYYKAQIKYTVLKIFLSELIINLHAAFLLMPLLRIRSKQIHELYKDESNAKNEKKQK